MSMQEKEYISEIESILKKVTNSLKKEQIYNYDLLEAHDEVKNKLEEYKNKSLLADDIASILEKAKGLQYIN